MEQTRQPRSGRLYRPILETILVVLVIALVVAGNELVWTNVVGLSLVLHLVVLLVSTFRGFGAGSVAAVAAAAGLALMLDAQQWGTRVGLSRIRKWPDDQSRQR